MNIKDKMPWSEACCGGTLYINSSSNLINQHVWIFVWSNANKNTLQKPPLTGDNCPGTWEKKCPLRLSFGFVAALTRLSPNTWEEYNTCFSFRYALVRAQDKAKQLVYRHVPCLHLFHLDFHRACVFGLLCSTLTCPMSPARPGKHWSWGVLMLWFWS